MNIINQSINNITIRQSITLKYGSFNILIIPIGIILTSIINNIVIFIVF
jgi:hypothetical protein